MMKAIDNRNGLQKMDIVKALMSLAMCDTRDMVEYGQPPVISAFVARNRETICQLVMPTAGLVIVIEGRKEVIVGTDQRMYGAGDAFVLPANARVDVVNEPDSRTGFYRALFVRFSRELIIEAARLWPQFVGQETCSNDVTISADLCSAVLHGAEC